MTDKNDNATSHDSEPIDAHELLAKHRMIGVVWCIDDVQQLRPDLIADQAWQVLQEVEASMMRYSASTGRRSKSSPTSCSPCRTNPANRRRVGGSHETQDSFH